MMGLLCKLGFHSKCRGYENSYNLVNGFGRTDGINRTHITVAAKCYNCGEYFDHKYICLGVLPNRKSKPAANEGE